MLLFKAFLVAIALAGGKHRGGGGRPRVPRECKDLDDQAYANFLKNDNSDGLLDTLMTGTMYCTMNAKYAEWPGCPEVTEDATEEPAQRRNLRKGGHGGGKGAGKGAGRVKYNRGRFTMASGTSSVVQVEYNSEEDSTQECYYGDDMKFTVQNSELDDESLAGRRLLKRGGGRPRVTATVEMTQAGTSDAICGVSQELTCSVKDLIVVDGECNAVSVSCKTSKDSESDTRVMMTCYENEDDVKGWEDVEDCSADDEATVEPDNETINLDNSADITP